jgi:hypothetical protein
MAAAKEALEQVCARMAPETDSLGDRLSKQLSRIYHEVTERYRVRYLTYIAYDQVEAASLELMREDECRAECFWAMARNMEMQLGALGKRKRSSALGRECEKLRDEFDVMTDRYDALYFEEVRFLALRRDATERRLERLRDSPRDEMAVEDFCVTMQTSL